MLRFLYLSIFTLVFLCGCSVSSFEPETWPGSPCSEANRKGPDDAYMRLALDYVFPKLNGLTYEDATPQAVKDQHTKIADLRTNFLPTVQDACLQIHVGEWLDYYNNEADILAADRLKQPSERNDYDQKRKQEEDEKRALALKLGLSP